MNSAFLSIIANRHFRHLWTAQIFSQLSANIMIFLLALVTYQNTQSNTAVSGLFLAYGIPAFLFGMVSGVAVDHLDRRKVLLVCDLARAILVGGLFFLTNHLFLVYLLVFLNAMITQFYVPAEAPTIPRLVAPQFLMTANSLFSFTYYSSMAIGFILAGPILRLFGPQFSLIFLSGLFLIAAICVSRLPSQKNEGKSFKLLLENNLFSLICKVWDDLRQGFLYVKSMPVIFDALLLLAGTQVIIALLGTLGPGFADKVMEIDVRDASLVIIGPAVLGIILGALWVGNAGLRYQPKKLVRIGILAAGILLMLISLTVRLKRVAGLEWIFRDEMIFPLEISLFFLLGVANSLLDVPSNSVLQKETDCSMRGRIYGILTALVGGVGILPVIAGGLLADMIGVGKVIFILGILVFSYGIFRMKYNKTKVKS